MSPTGATFGSQMDALADMGSARAGLSGRMGTHVNLSFAGVDPSAVTWLGVVHDRADLTACRYSWKRVAWHKRKSHLYRRQFSADGGRDGPRGPLVQIGNYDGETDLTAFPSHFKRMAQLYCWFVAEQVIFLETSLKGAAADIVYEVESTMTVEEMKDM